MSGKTCAGTLVTGLGKDGCPRKTYLYHVVDNEWSMREYGSQAVVWQTAINPVVALELLAKRPNPVNRGGAEGEGGLRSLDRCVHRENESTHRNKGCASAGPGYGSSRNARG